MFVSQTKQSIKFFVGDDRWVIVLANDKLASKIWIHSHHSRAKLLSEKGIHGEGVGAVELHDNAVLDKFIKEETKIS